MRYRGALGWLVGLTAMLAAPAVAQAATVNSTADSGPGSLRDAIAASASGETINFDASLTGQTITLTTGALMVTHSLTISGPGAASLTINGGNLSSVFDIDTPVGSHSSVTISGLTVTGGKGGDPGGGGIIANTVDSVTLTGDTISGNQASVRTNDAGGGGGVYVNGGTLVIQNSTITNNKLAFTLSAGASGGGGVYDNHGAVTVTGSDISGNTVTHATSLGDSGGGGIYSNGGDVDVSSSTVRNNSYDITSSSGSDDGGGGVYSNGGAVSLEVAAIDGNSFTVTSGALGNYGGGGVYVNGRPVTVLSSTIDGNSVTVGGDTGGDDGGGGLVSQGGEIGVALSSISNNTVNITDSGGDDGGGAILDQSGGGTYVTSTFSGNSTTISGGGIDDGGGAILSFGSTLTSSLTIAGNNITGGDGATTTSGGAIFSDGTVEFENTIVAGNSPGNCAGGATFTSHGFNLESANTCGFTAGGDLVNTDPRLGPLQNNGGSTLTQALGAGSPAIDAGSCTDFLGSPLTVDQRLVARPQPAGGRCDIGAYELVPAAPPPPPSKPAAVPGKPAAVSSTGASFSGTVNPEGQATTVVFQFGIDGRFRPGGGIAIIYDQSTAPQSLPADSVSHAVTASATGLVPNALYHVRVVATNASGTTFGPDQTFTTPADPPPPPPVLGKAVNAMPVSGQVFVLVGKKLVPLTEADQLRSGTVLDTRRGSVQLTTASSQKHKRQIGVFSGAIFKLTQAHSSLTTLSLMENAFSGAPSFASCSSKGAHAAALSNKQLQLLHASAKGKFRTRGRYAAATVRGTKWTIADRCDGTLTHDLTDSVVVNDFVRHETIVLHHGQSYLAKATAPKKKKKP
ncbi:MAG TPA: choice-of-anchor Q domain-containing protein [Solirubrobacteraceae bacterium]|nr:choice-of-anchor Q domain-containing protein [Solirubrobacteraceae bacterium]